MSSMISETSEEGSLLSKATKLFSPSNIVLQAATTAERKASQQSIELFGYDFVSLIMKLLIYFATAFAVAKVMEAIVFARGAFTVIAGLFGINIPKSDQLPQSLIDLFGEGFHGVKYWDAVKVVAILLVVVEYLRYVDVNEKNGGKASAMTTGVFLMIGLGLSLITIPELVKRLKSADFDIQSLR